MENEKKYNYIEKMHKLFKGFNVNETIITKDIESDLLKIYLADIRNLRKLDKEMINNISDFSKENIINILNSYNDIVVALNNYIEKY